MNRRFRAWLITACIVLALLFLLGPLQQISVVTGQGGDPRKPKPTPTPAPSTKSTRPPAGKRTPPNATRGGGTPTRSILLGQAGIKFVGIPAGEFIMGSNSSGGDEKPVHRVKISQLFMMGIYEVTQGQWRSVMGNNPSSFKNCDNCPVEQVSWDDAQEFLAKLNERNDGFHYRLPSEAEWEYACRAGTTGDYAGDLDSMAWYSANSGSKTHPVGAKQPNGFGLYDMHGNVWEWCQDWYHETYYGAPTDGSAWLSEGDQKYRVLRGGSWLFNATVLRSALRGWSTPDFRNNNNGFRVVAVR